MEQGSGDARYLKSDAITEVEGGGIDTCETELIESVDDTRLPNVNPHLRNHYQGFDCFEPGDVVQGIIPIPGNSIFSMFTDL